MYIHIVVDEATFYKYITLCYMTKFVLMTCGVCCSLLDGPIPIPGSWSGNLSSSALRRCTEGVLVHSCTPLGDEGECTANYIMFSV